MKLPPRVTQAQLAEGLSAFRRIVGAEWVFASEEDVDLYRDAYSPLWNEPDEFIPAAAVAPKSVEEVQAIVRAANAFHLPLFPISTGKNLGYGGTAPNLSGSVIVDLKRMNKIIEVNDERNYCIVEPGVSYFDLYEYIQARGLKVMIDTPDPGWGSPLGNALDHGNGYGMGPYRDHFGAHCGMEVVLPDGDVMRTGMGAVPGAETFAEFRYGYGPSVDGLFAQANFGIVTKMGFWLSPRPEHFLIGDVTVPNYTDIEALAKEVNHLEDQFLIGFPRYFSQLDPVTLLISPELKPDSKLLELIGKPGGAGLEELQDYATRNKVPFWGVTLHFYGPRATTYANWEYAKQRLGKIPGVRFTLRDSLALPLTPEQEARYHQKVTVGIPNMSIFSMVSRSPMTPYVPDGHIAFTAIIPRSGASLIEAHKVLSKAAADLGLPPILGFFSPPLTWQQRTWLVSMPFHTFRSNTAANKKVLASYAELVRVAAAHGWTEYRTAPVFQDIVAKTYSFNDNRLLRFQTQLKDAVDPNGIIAPGRGGIWPKPYRKGQ